jgi:hypothetical protein
MRLISPWDLKSIKDPELKKALLSKCEQLVKDKEENPVQFFFTHGGPNDSIIVTTIFYEGDWLVEDWIRVLGFINGDLI